MTIHRSGRARKGRRRLEWGMGLLLRDRPACERPRERLLARGPSALSDVELAAVVLGTGRRGRDVLAVASDVVARLADARRESRAPTLREIAGIGPAQAARLAAAFELARRHLDASLVRIASSEDAVPFLSFIADRKQEHLVCMSLSGAHEVFATRVVTVGTVNANLVHPREVFADPIADRAAAVILAHNHPSGSLEPSAEDIRVTARLREAGKILGIEVLDHLVVTRRGWRRIGGSN